jgi:polysaccharide biosynthesis protein PelG
VLFGGIHLIYTRIVADLLFVNKQGEASGSLVFFIALISAAALAITIPVYLSFEAPVENQGLYRIAAILLFTVINIVWVLMIFITLLRRYVLILLIYAGGIVLAVVLVRVLSEKYGMEGALLGFALGHLSIALSLALLAFLSHRPKEIRKGWSNLKSYLSRFSTLLATGYFYNWAIWVDKIIFWYTKGEAVPDTIFRLYEAYDVAVYMANLSMIPGLVYFVIISETSFYVQLRKFLLTLSKGTLLEIQQRKRMLLVGVRSHVRQQALFQGIFTASLLFLAPALVTSFGPGAVSPLTLRIVLVGVFLHFLALTVMNYHFYFEFFNHALIMSILFFAVNSIVTLLMAFNLLPFIPGVGYGVGGLCAAVYSYTAIQTSGKKFDRRILAKSSGV